MNTVNNAWKIRDANASEPLTVKDGKGLVASPSALYVPKVSNYTIKCDDCAESVGSFSIVCPTCVKARCKACSPLSKACPCCGAATKLVMVPYRLLTTHEVSWVCPPGRVSEKTAAIQAAVSLWYTLAKKNLLHLDGVHAAEMWMVAAAAAQVGMADQAKEAALLAHSILVRTYETNGASRLKRCERKE